MPVYATRSITVNTVSGTATSVSTSWIPLNIHETPFNVGFGAIVHGAGKITYRVEHTFDDVFDSSVTPSAFLHEDVSAESASKDGNYAYPVRAVRLAIVSASASAGVSLTLIQTGI